MVRARRQQLNWTQEELADRVRMSQRWVSNLELGNVGQSRLATLRKLAEVLGLDLSDLVLAAGMSTSEVGAHRIAETAIQDYTASDREAEVEALVHRIDWEREGEGIEMVVDMLQGLANRLPKQSAEREGGRGQNL